MNNERYKQIIDEAYENYKTKTEIMMGHGFHGTLMSHEEFNNKCITDIEFSKRWGLKIEEIKLTWEEQVQWVMKNTDVEWENLYIVEEIAKDTTPKRLLTVTYKDEKIKVYE